MAVQFTESTKRALHKTAAAIAPDVLDDCANNTEFIELVLDADHVSIHGSREAGMEIQSLIWEHGYEVVHAAVSLLGSYK